MPSEQFRQPSAAIMEPQNLSPEVLGPAEQVRADAEDMGQDEVLGRSCSQRLSGVSVVCQKQGFMVLGVHLPDYAIAPPRKQVGQAQADLTSHPDVVPGKRVQIGSTQLQNKRVCRSFFAPVPSSSITLLILRSESDGIFEWQ